MTNVQLYFAIGVPMFTFLLTLIVGIYHLNHLTNQMNARFTSLESTMNARFSMLEGRMNLFDQDLKTLVRASNEVDNRLSRLEERLAR